MVNTCDTSVRRVTPLLQQEKENTHCENIEQYSNLLASLSEDGVPSARKNSSEFESKKVKPKLQQKQWDTLADKVKTHYLRTTERPGGLSRRAPSAPVPPGSIRIRTIHHRRPSEGLAQRYRRTLHVLFPECLPYRFTAYDLPLAVLIVVLVSLRLCFSDVPRGLGLPTGAWLANIDRSAYLWHSFSHSSPSTPLQMARQTACQSSCTGDGVHLLSATLVVSLNARSIPSSALRSVNYCIRSRTAASGKSSLLNLGPTSWSATQGFSKSPMFTASFLSHLDESSKFTHHL